MARTRSVTYCSILTDADWLALTRNARFLYSILLLQPKLTLAGSLDYLPQRWTTACDASVEEIEEWLEELEDHDFIAIDHDTYEVVVRTFTKHDIGENANSNVVKGLWAAWTAIESERLRHIVVASMPDEVFAKGEPPEEAQVKRQIPVPEERPSERPSERSIERPSERSPEPPASCFLLPTPASGLLPPRRLDLPAARDRFDEFWLAFPIKTGKKPARRNWDKAVAAGADPQDIIDGAIRYAASLAPDDKIKYPQGWLTDERWTDQPLPYVPPLTKQDQDRLTLLDGLARAESRPPGANWWDDPPTDLPLDAGTPVIEAHAKETYG